MTLKVNSHVLKLYRYLPFSPLHSQIYEEQANPDHMKSIPTRAGKSLVSIVRDKATRLVILTGDAGHGKTHLCRRLLEEVLHLEPRDAHECLKARGDGVETLGRVASRDLYVVRDLSEVDEDDHAIRLLASALEDPGRVLVVCANEGKLRKVVSVASEELKEVRETLEGSRERGWTSVDPRVTVLDLNNQSVTAGEEEGFLGELLQQWVRDGRSWRICAECDAAMTCPIKQNRDRLAGEDDEVLGGIRRDGFHTLLRVIEQCGVSVTIRELLILLAFAITGGKDCVGVHQRYRQKPEDRSWQSKHLYSQVVFDPPIARDNRKALSILSVLSRIDPGRQAIRAIDDVLAADPLLVDDTFAPERIEGTTETPKSRLEAKKEASLHSALFAFLRRRDFFELLTENGRLEQASRSERLGFRYHEEFQFLLTDASPSDRTQIRNKVLRGLEAVQDIRRGSSPRAKFAVVDPAFANVRGNASILSAMLPVTSIQVLSQSSLWDKDGATGELVSGAVDWVDRDVVVRFGDSGVNLTLDLLQFEFVLRSAEGLSSRNFYKADIRRISTTLAQLTAAVQNLDNEINVVYADRNIQLFIDEGGRIGCQGGL